MTISNDSNLSSFDWKDRSDHAKNYFSLKFPRYKQLSEDFSQWCLLKWLEGFYLNTDNVFYRMALDYLKREHRHHRGRVDLDKHVKLGGIDPLFDSEITKAMNQLEGRDRAIFALCYKWDLTNEEIGECFGMNANAVGQHLFNLRNKIKKQNKYS